MKSSVILQEANGKTFSLENNPSTKLLQILDGSDVMMTAGKNQTNFLQNVYADKNVIIGSETNPGDHSINLNAAVGVARFDIVAGDGEAYAYIKSNGGAASMEIAASAGKDATLALLESSANSNYRIMNKGGNGFGGGDFVITQGSSEIIRIEKTSRSVTFKNDLTIGGNSVSGPRAATISASGGAATLDLYAVGGASAMSLRSTVGDSVISLQSPAGKSSAIVFQETSGRKFTLMNNGATDTFGLTDEYYSCATEGGVGTGDVCDSNYDGVYQETCVQGALCRVILPNNGGCGSLGSCVPNTLMEIKPISGNTKFKGNLEIGGSTIFSSGPMNLETTWGTLVVQSLGQTTGDNGVEIKSSGDSHIALDTNGAGSIMLGTSGFDLQIVRPRAFAGSGKSTYFTGQEAASGRGGDILFRGGQASGNFAGGDVVIDGGDFGSSTSTYGAVFIGRNSSAVNLYTTRGGAVTLSPSGQTSTGASGDVRVIGAKFIVDTQVLLVDPTLNRVGINTASPSVDLDVVGSVKVSVGLTVGGGKGNHSATISSTDNAASLIVQSGGSSDASVSIVSPSGQSSKLVLTEGSHSFVLMNEVSTNKFVIANGTTNLLSLDPTTGAVQMNGDFTVGGVSASGQRAATVKGTTANLVVQASSGMAEVSVTSAGSYDAAVKISSATNQNAQLVLQSGSSAYTIKNEGSTNMLRVGNGATELMTINPATGVTTITGDLAVGSFGASLASIISTDSTATLLVSAGGSNSANVVVQAQAGYNALLSLGTTTRSMDLMYDSQSDCFVIRNSTMNLLSVSASTGNTILSGDLTVGGNSGNRAATIQSNGGTAQLYVVATGAGSASMRVKSDINSAAQILFQEGSNIKGGIQSDGTNDLIKITDGATKDLWTIKRSTGAMSINGDLTVGVSGGAAQMTVKSTSGDASILVQSSSGSNANILVSGGAPKVVFSETAGASYTVAARTNAEGLNELSFETVSGSTTKHLTITNAGVPGTSNIQTWGDMMVGSVTRTGPISAIVVTNSGTSSLDVTSLSGVAQVNITSGGVYDASSIISAPAGRTSSLVLSEGVNSFKINNNGATGLFTITDGVSDLLTVASSGQIVAKGDLTVGNNTGARTVQVVSTSGVASINAISGGMGIAQLRAVSPSGISSKVHLAEGSNYFDLVHDAANAKFSVRNSVSDLLTIERASGKMVLSGDLTVGNSSAARLLSVISTSDVASLRVQSGGNSSAIVEAIAPANMDAKLVLTEGIKSFEVKNNGATDLLVINDGSNDLMTIARGTGFTSVKGNMTIGATAGAKVLSVTSTTSSAAMQVTAGAGDASVTLTSPSAQSSMLVLGETGGVSYSLINDGASDSFKLKSGSTNLLSIGPVSAGGVVTSYGDLVVGGVTVAGPRQASIASLTGTASLYVTSASGVATMTVQSGGANKAEVNVKSENGQNSKVVLTKGSDSFTIQNDGANGNLAIRDNSSDLMTIASVSGAVWMKGNLTVGNSAAAAAATIRSTESSATLQVEAGGTSQASVTVQSAANANAVLNLVSANTFTITNDATANMLKFTDGTNDLLTIERSTRAAVFKGDLTVSSTSGNRMMIVQSTTGNASVTVQAGGTGIPSVNIRAATGNNAALTLGTANSTLSIVNDVAFGKMAFRDETSDLFTIEAGTGNAFIKGTISTSSIGSTIQGIAKSDNDALILTNMANNADMDNTRLSITFKQYYYDAGGAAQSGVAMAKITAGTESDWTADTNTQNSFLSMNLIKNGVLNERLRITSTGNVGIGTSSPTAKLSVAGSAAFQENLLIGGGTGARTLSVDSTDGTATATVTSTAAAAMIKVESIAASATMQLIAPSGQDAQVILTQGATGFIILHRGSLDQFVITDGTNDVLTIAATTGNTALRGNLTVGSAGTGERKATIQSADSNAQLNVVSALSGTASISATAANGQSSKLVLASGSNSFEVVNDGANDALLVTDGSNTLMRVTRLTGAFYSKGDLTVGSGANAMAATIKSTASSASLIVASTTSSASGSIIAAAGYDATLKLISGSSSMNIVNTAASGKLSINNGTDDLFTIAQSTGNLATRGSMTVGGLAITGEKHISVLSSDAAASLSVTAGGTSAATVTVSSPASQDSSVTLAETGGKSWYLKNKGSSNSLIVGEGSNEWLSIADTGSSLFKADLATNANLMVGGVNTTGAKSASITSGSDVASLAISGLSGSMTLLSTGATSDTSLSLTSQTGRKSTISLVEDGAEGASFSLLNDGSTNMFKIKSTTDLMTIAASTGDMTIKGGLDVNSGKFVIDPSTGFAGVWTSTPTVQLHVNGSMRVENGDLDVGSGKFYVSSATGYIGINNYAPTSALHVKGDVKIVKDDAGVGGSLYATKGSVHLKYSAASAGSIDREYFLSTSTGVTLPTDTSLACTSNCVPSSSRIYIIRNSHATNSVTITCSSTIKVRKNGATAASTMSLPANGFAMCAFNSKSSPKQYDCWTWGA